MSQCAGRQHSEQRADTFFMPARSAMSGTLLCTLHLSSAARARRACFNIQHAQTSQQSFELRRVAGAKDLPILRRVPGQNLHQVDTAQGKGAGPSSQFEVPLPPFPLVGWCSTNRGCMFEAVASVIHRLAVSGVPVEKRILQRTRENFFGSFTAKSPESGNFSSGCPKSASCRPEHFVQRRWNEMDE